MIYQERARSSDPLSAIESRNREILTLGGKTGIAVLTLLPLISHVTNNWAEVYPFSPEIQTAFDSSVEALLEYAGVFAPPLPIWERDPLTQETEIVKRYLHPESFGRSHTIGTRKGWDEWEKGEPERFRTYLLKFKEVLTEVFSLPRYSQETVHHIPPDSLPALLDWVHAPRGLEGLRFLPGYRKLRWGEEDTTAGTMDVVYREDVPLDIVQFQKRTGREFFLASTGGLYELDAFLRRSSEFEQIHVVSATTKEKKKTKRGKPGAVVDRDGTIGDRSSWHNDTEDVCQARASFFHTLSRMGVTPLIWTRNEYDFSKSSDMLAQSLGVTLARPISFPNWPFLEIERNGVKEFHPEKLHTAFEQLPPSLHEFFLRYARENFGKESLAELHEKIREFLQLHMDNYTSEDYPYEMALLEAKIPAFVALTQYQFSEKEREDFLERGVLINDEYFSLTSMKVFGYSFIHVDHASQVDYAADILALLYSS